MLDRIARNRGLVSYPGWKVSAIALAAKVLGITVHIEGLPFGGHRGPAPKMTKPSSQFLTGGMTLLVVMGIVLVVYVEWFNG